MAIWRALLFVILSFFALTVLASAIGPVGIEGFLVVGLIWLAVYRTPLGSDRPKEEV